MAEMPTLGKSRRASRRSYVIPIVIALVIATIVWFRWRSSKVAAPPPPPADPKPIVKAPPKAPPPAPAPPRPEEVLKQAGFKHVHVIVAGPLESALVNQIGKSAALPLTQMVVRALVWWVEIPNDLRKGDTLDVLYQEAAEPIVEAVRFNSQKNGRSYRAYRFQPSNEQFAHYIQPDGDELEMRLKDGPLDQYEQITSLLRDGRGHKGVDFKTPVGTVVKAPFDAEIARRNWNFRANGNCLQIREVGGKHRVADFLHLSELAPSPRVGERVARGQAIAKTGNTGRSFAPHLHYQLMTGDGSILDPFTSHETWRKKLPDAEKPAFEARMHKLDDLIDLANRPIANLATPDGGLSEH